MALGSKRSKCPKRERQSSLISLHLKIESIIAGPLDRLHRRGEEVENKRRGLPSGKTKAFMTTSLMFAISLPAERRSEVTNEQQAGRAEHPYWNVKWRWVKKDQDTNTEESTLSLLISPKGFIVLERFPLLVSQRRDTFDLDTVKPPCNHSRAKATHLPTSSMAY